jgi:hypothetical protein
MTMSSMFPWFEENWSRLLWSAVVLAAAIVAAVVVRAVVFWALRGIARRKGAMVGSGAYGGSGFHRCRRLAVHPAD